MRQYLGETRSRVCPHHAIISPDSHERVSLEHWKGGDVIHLISPDMGAKFSMFLLVSPSGIQAPSPPHSGERFILVREGQIQLTSGDLSHTLLKDDYAYLPAGQDHKITADAAVEMLILERAYVPGPAIAAPKIHVSSISAVPSSPMKGDERLQFQKLLPQGLEFDMEINIMDFQPGASLPYVETHFMEHGLLLLNGGGIYRLENEWSPVAAGDAIWMGPYCPQWFAAVGRENARYLIYKNWNRDPLS